MSRNLDSTLAAHLGDSLIYPIVLAQIGFKSQVEYAWSGLGTLVWNGMSFKGVGSLGAVGSISEGVDVQASGTSVGLSGIDPVFRSECLTDIQQGAAAKIWYGQMAPGGASGYTLVGVPCLMFSGVVDYPVLSIGGAKLDINLMLESRMVNFQRPNNRRYTNADQRLSFPNDSAFTWVEIENDIALVWG